MPSDHPLEWKRKTVKKMSSDIRSMDEVRNGFSMPLFQHPRDEVKLSEEYTAGSYLEERLNEIGHNS